MQKLFTPALVAVAVVIIAIVIWKLVPQKEAVLAPKIENSIAVISFENQTRNKAYDYLQKAIPNLLITSFEQAGLLYVATWERMYDLLKQMGKEHVETKRLLKSTSSKGKGADSILETQIDTLSREVSQGIGIAEKKIEAAQIKVEDITTNSIDDEKRLLT